MKQFKDMTWYEFNKTRKNMSSHRLSAFPRYCQALRGYEFYLNGRQVFRWELFDWGYKNVIELLDNKTDIRAIYVNDEI